jgi:NhaA family Na+:H+ antiporter
MIKKSLKNFFKLEAATGILLAIATILALLIANSAGNNFYQYCFTSSLSNNTSIINHSLSLRDLINDGFMAIFFLLVGLELKKEVLIGELSSKAKVALPLIAACGGVIFPALIFAYFNFNDEKAIHGFAIPTATDIAFAYGVISFFGKKFSNSLKIFLVSLAVIDDLIAILIIAIFYSGEIDVVYLLYSLAIIGALFFLNYRSSNNLFLYSLLGVLLWLVILKSGIHATLAGVILSIFIPLQIRNEKFLEKLTKKIAPIVNFFILPIFAFANAGVVLGNFSWDILFANLVLGIILALFIGKQLGVMLFSFIAIKLKLTNLPKGTNWLEFYAVAIFTGIGFTMSLFIGSLAFLGNDLILEEVKIGVLGGSLLSIVYGFMIAGLIRRK